MRHAAPQTSTHQAPSSWMPGCTALGAWPLPASVSTTATCPPATRPLGVAMWWRAGTIEAELDAGRAPDITDPTVL
jgi:hypothetical protein